jgi:hypothetical protein
VVRLSALGVIQQLRGQEEVGGHGQKKFHAFTPTCGSLNVHSPYVLVKMRYMSIFLGMAGLLVTRTKGRWYVCKMCMLVYFRGWVVEIR